jgi:hypothetical protein
MPSQLIAQRGRATTGRAGRLLRAGGTCVAVALVLALAAPGAQAAAPWWNFTSSARPSLLPKGGEGIIGFRANNVGDAPAFGEGCAQVFAGTGKFTNSECTEEGRGAFERTTIVITATLPEGLSVKPVSPGQPDAEVLTFPETNNGTEKCSEPEPRQIRCTYEAELAPYEYVEVTIPVTIAAQAHSGVASAVVSGGGAPSVGVQQAIAVGEGPTPFGVEHLSIVPEREGGGLQVQAGAHPYQLTTTFALNQTADPLRPPALPKELKFSLSPGLVANAVAFPECSETDFLTKAFGGFADDCPNDTAIGVVLLTLDEPIFGGLKTYPVPLFNLKPSKGEPVRFGFFFIGAAVPIDFSIRPGGDYGATATVSDITQVTNFLAESLTVWGVPGEASHDASRGWGCVAKEFFSLGGRVPCLPADEVNPPPFLTLPTSCATPFAATVEGHSWPFKSSPQAEAASISLPEAEYRLTDSLGRLTSITGCDRLPFDPSITVRPDVSQGSSSTGLNVDVHVPQDVSENADGLASSAVKDITVALPEGVTVNPSSANGLEACSEEEIGFRGFHEFNAESEPGNATAVFTPTLESPFCPTASRLASVEIHTPLLKSPFKGSFYLASQNSNPFGSLIAAYIVAEDEEAGVLVKLPGKVELSGSGQLVSTFQSNPDVPFEDASIEFFGGERAPLSTPAGCHNYTTDATFVPWSAEGWDEAAQTKTSSSTFAITSGPRTAGEPGGSPCPGATLPFSPTLAGGGANIAAGAFSPVTTTINRRDGEQNLQSVQIKLPPGVSGILTGIPLCPEAQANEGTCSAASLIGETTVSAGVGSDPITVKGGKVYLTETYAGAPFGLSIVNPVKAGPFDLEHDTSNPADDPACDCVVVRAKIEVNPFTAELTTTTDASGAHAIPHMIDGVPVQIRAVNVTINRPGFTFNPTNCGVLALTGTITGDEGAGASVSTPFQVANCSRLQFAPKFAATTSAKTSKADGASLSVKLSYPNAPFGSQANIAKVKVDLPKQLPSRLTTLQKACLASVFEANPAGCPAASIVGSVKVTTPLIPVPLVGPAYFVSHGNESFPSLTMVLQGYGIKIELVGSTFIKKGITSTTFKAAPDAPFNTFELVLPEGKFSALAANANLCKTKLPMPTAFVAQDGAELHETIEIGVSGCPKAKAKAKSHRGKGRRK